MRTVSLFILIFAFAPDATRVARADPPAPTSTFRPAGGAARASASREEARRHFQQGVALHADGNFSGALAEFQAAQELWAASGATLDALTALFNVGGLLRELQRFTDAITALERFVADSENVPQATKSQRAELKQMRADAQQLVNEMAALLAPITVVVTPATAQALQVLIDGRGVALKDTQTIKLPAGAHVIEASAEGHTPLRREIAVVAGRAQRVEITLKPVVRTGHVTISSSRPNTEVVIDGKALGLAPVTVELGAGGHRLEASSPGFQTHRSELALAAGQTREIQVMLEPPPALVVAGASAPLYKKWWFWTGLAVVAAGGVAAAFVPRTHTQDPLVGSLPPGSVSAQP